MTWWQLVFVILATGVAINIALDVFSRPSGGDNKGGDKDG